MTYDEDLCLCEGQTATEVPCPSCGREIGGRWIVPCPEDGCPSHHEEDPAHDGAACALCREFAYNALQEEP